MKKLRCSTHGKSRGRKEKSQADEVSMAKGVRAQRARFELQGAGDVYTSDSSISVPDVVEV